MTEQNDTQLVPGREMDAAVARALGLKVIQLTPDCEAFAERDVSGYTMMEPLPAYSSDMGACWREVVPEFGKAGCCLKIEDGGGLSTVTISRDDVDLIQELVGTHLVPAALCRALLKIKKGEGK